MSEEERVAQQNAQQPSVLELCMSQQSHHQSGIRQVPTLQQPDVLKPD